MDPDSEQVTLFPISNCEMSWPVYLDYNATTTLDPGVVREIERALTESWGNPSSSYSLGRSARSLIEKCRAEVAQMVNMGVGVLIFMSGGTEANMVALSSVIAAQLEFLKSGIDMPHVITSNVEHDSVIKCLEYWSDEGKIELTVVDVNKETGCISVDSVISKIKSNTSLVSIMHANNETGIIMPIAEIGDQLESLNEERVPSGLPRIFYHTDAAQTIGKIPVDVTKLKVDYLTIVGHKFYGPRIGALYVKDKTPVLTILHGCGEERGFRSGTENTPMIAGLGHAASLVKKHIMKYNLNMKLARDTLQEKLKLRIPELQINFLEGDRLPNTLSVCVPPYLLASDVLKKCGNKVFAGAASCSNVDQPSRILIASGLSDEEATRTIRFSVGRTTSLDEIDIAVETLVAACL